MPQNRNDSMASLENQGFIVEFLAFQDLKQRLDSRQGMGTT